MRGIIEVERSLEILLLGAYYKVQLCSSPF